MVDTRFRVHIMCCVLALAVDTCGGKPWHWRRRTYLATQTVSDPWRLAPLAQMA